MNGTVIPNTPIAVDFWKVRDCPSARLFFLTHLHGDHITGLTSSWKYPIYCSETTGDLLKSRLGVKHDLVHTMKVNCPEIVYLDAERLEQMTVTPLDANHCPGSVMFLFEGYFGTILHTGDFRFQPQMFAPGSKLLEAIGKVDVLYLDNTYCSPYCKFPSRDVCIRWIMDIIESDPKHNVLIGMRNLGKEDLLCEIAKHFQEWISVPSHMYSTTDVLGLPDVFRNNDNTCRIRVVPFQSISTKFVKILNLNKQCPTIVILPTALYCGIDARPFENQKNVYVVPLSDHSSYKELVTFVSTLKPRKIIPIVKHTSRGPFGLSVADRADMSCFQKYLFPELPVLQTISVPSSVEAFMRNSLMSLEKKQMGKKRKLKGAQLALIKVPKRGVVFDSPNGKEDVKSQNSSISTSKNLGSDKKDIKAKSALFEKKPSSIISEQLPTESKKVTQSINVCDQKESEKEKENLSIKYSDCQTGLSNLQENQNKPTEQYLQLAKCSVIKKRFQDCSTSECDTTSTRAEKTPRTHIKATSNPIPASQGFFVCGHEDMFASQGFSVESLAKSNSMEDQEDPLLALLDESYKRTSEMQPRELSNIDKSANNSEMSNTNSYCNNVEQHQKSSRFANKLELSESCTSNSCEITDDTTLQSDNLIKNVDTNDSKIAKTPDNIPITQTCESFQSSQASEGIFSQEILMATKVLLDKNPDISQNDIAQQALYDNIDNETHERDEGEDNKMQERDEGEDNEMHETYEGEDNEMHETDEEVENNEMLERHEEGEDNEMHETDEDVENNEMLERHEEEGDDNEMHERGEEKGEESQSLLSSYWKAESPCNSTKKESDSKTVNEHHAKEIVSDTWLSKPISVLKKGQRKKKYCQTLFKECLHSSSKNTETNKDSCVEQESEDLTHHHNQSETAASSDKLATETVKIATSNDKLASETVITATSNDKLATETVISEVSETNNNVVLISDESDMSIDKDSDSSDQHEVLCRSSFQDDCVAKGSYNSIHINCTDVQDQKSAGTVCKDRTKDTSSETTAHLIEHHIDHSQIGCNNLENQENNGRVASNMSCQKKQVHISCTSGAKETDHVTQVNMTCTSEENKTDNVKQVNMTCTSEENKTDNVKQVNMTCTSGAQETVYVKRADTDDFVHCTSYTESRLAKLELQVFNEVVQNALIAAEEVSAINTSTNDNDLHLNLNVLTLQAQPLSARNRKLYSTFHKYNM